MFLLLNKATIRLLIKESRKATFTTAICSAISNLTVHSTKEIYSTTEIYRLRYQTVQYTVLIKYTVWGLKLETALVNTASSVYFIMTWW